MTLKDKIIKLQELNNRAVGLSFSSLLFAYEAQQRVERELVSLEAEVFADLEALEARAAATVLPADKISEIMKLVYAATNYSETIGAEYEANGRTSNVARFVKKVDAACAEIKARLEAIGR